MKFLITGEKGFIEIADNEYFSIACTHKGIAYVLQDRESLTNQLTKMIENKTQ